ncbi:MAG: transcription termination factor Rho [Actinomycetota bacterium]
MDTTTDRSALEGKLIPELQQIAQRLGIEGSQKLRKAGLVDAIVERSSGEGATANGPAASVNESVRGETPGGETATREETSTDDGGSNGQVDAGDIDRSTGRDADARNHRSRADTSQGERQPGDRQPGDRQPGDRQPGDRSQGSRPRNDRSQGDRQGGDRAQGDRPQGDRPQGDRPRGDGQDDRPEGRDDRSEGPRGDRRGRPSREERRRVREERRLREEQERAEELQNAPVLTGILDILPEGYGFLRTSGYLPGPEDIYVSLSQVRRFSLRKGDTVAGRVRRPKDNEKYFALLEIDSVNGMDVEAARERPNFDKLTPLFPEERFRLENGPLSVAERIIDMVAPIGKGQRGMVVSPPKGGKTTILKQIANGILNSSPDTHVIVLLVDERPEEVTDWQRTVLAAEVVYSTFDKPADQHIQVTELVLERARRLAEMGQDVAILLDSVTRLARAYNLAAPASGKILSGGVDSTALYPPKRFFGAARNIEEGGSLTIIASALVETGSRMDEVIFEEFKGTGNMELRLDRSLAEKRLFPAINVDASGTRKEERLMPVEELALVVKLRRVLHALEPGAALELLIDKIRATKSNEQFLKEIAKAPSGS